MTEPTIICPNCKTVIKLTESLAGPLIAQTRKQFELKLQEKDKEISSREESLSVKEKMLEESRRKIDEQVAFHVEKELQRQRAVIIEDEARKAKLVHANELESKSRELLELQEVLRVRDDKLAEAQKAQAEILKKQRDLDDAKREFDLTLEKRLQERIAEIHAQAKKDAEDSLRLQVMEKDKTIVSMQQTIEELKHKAERGSPQIQGEIQEIILEDLLRNKFPFDSIESVPKGEFGGDVIQRVVNQLGQTCGNILWESKRTKNWSDGWLTKLREDQRTAKADIAILVSQALPKEIETFDVIDGVWITNARSILPVATILRHSLVELALARQATEGQQTKTELVYQYLTGPRFRLRVEAIVEAFSSMQEDLDKERKAILRQWAKREQQIERVMNATVGMYGDLQGIAGKSLQEIKGLELDVVEIEIDDAKTLTDDI